MSNLFNKNHWYKWMKNINCNPYEKNILNYVLTNLILISHSKKKKFNFFVKYKIIYIMHITNILYV